MSLTTTRNATCRLSTVRLSVIFQCNLNGQGKLLQTSRSTAKEFEERSPMQLTEGRTFILTTA